MKQTKHFQFWPTYLTKTITIPESTVYNNLLVSAKRYPEKNVLEYYGLSMTYKTLLESTNHLAEFMRKEWDIQKDDRIMIFMQNSPQYFIALFAILKLGAIVVPINPMSTKSELSYYMTEGNIHHAIVGQELMPSVESFTNEQLQVIVATYNDYVNEEQSIGQLPNEVKLSFQRFEHTIAWKDIFDQTFEKIDFNKDEGESNHLAIMPYTSGTTGEPKGCLHTNRSIQANIVGSSHWMSMTTNSVSLTTLPLFHVTGLIHSGLAPIFTGSTIVLMTRWDKEYAACAIEHYRCTNWINISTMVIDFLSNPYIHDYNLSSLMIVGGGGAALPEAVGQRLFELTGLKYIEGYGLSETMSHTHFNPVHRPKLQCLGIPAFDVDARILDVETGEQLGINEEGELIVHAPQMFIGYDGRNNEDTFIEIEGKKFFKTGDIVVVDEEGYFFIVDRIKRMINASGFKVWPSEVESILYRHHAVQQACVVRSYDKKRGETVKALIILKDEYVGKVSEEDIINWSKKEMAAYKYPRIVEFWDTFPMTSSGKVLWKQLQDKMV